MGNLLKVRSMWLMVAVIMAVFLVGCSDTGLDEAADLGLEAGLEAGTKSEETKGKTEVATSVSGQLKVHYIDAGQSDATLLELTGTGEDYTMLIDTGDFKSTDVVDYLNSVGVKDIDVVVGTHPHADHIGQLDKVLTEFDVGEVWMSGDVATSQVFLKSLEVIDSKGVGYEEPRAGDVYDLGDMNVEVISPNSVSGDLNNGSISMRVTYGEVDFIFTGDAETKAEQGILSRGHNVKAKIMHLGHHGSKTSTIPEFLKAVNPEVAIYSAGKGNSYGHPSKEVVDRVQDSGVTLYGTDTHGTVILTTDGKTYDIKTNNEGTIVPPKEVNETVEKEVVEVPVVDKEVPVVSGSCVDVNTASAGELQSIKHIGESRVNDVINLRPYSSLDELTKVSGIGASRVDDIKAQGLACVN